MKKEEITGKIQEIINKVTDIPVEEMSADSAMMDDLDLSSLEVMTMIADLEKMFKIRIPEKELRNFVTIDDIASYLQNVIA